MSTLIERRPSTTAARDFGAELASPAALEDPHPVFHRMRREDPVHHSRSLGAWIVTRHEDVLRAFRDARLSSGRVPGSRPSWTRRSGHRAGGSSRIGSVPVGR